MGTGLQFGLIVSLMWDKGWLERTGPGTWNGARGGKVAHGTSPQRGHQRVSSPDVLRDGALRTGGGGGAGAGTGSGIWLAPRLSRSGVGLRTGVAAGRGLERGPSNLLYIFTLQMSCKKRATKSPPAEPGLASCCNSVPCTFSLVVLRRHLRLYAYTSTRLRTRLTAQFAE